MNDKKVENAIEILENHNKWRRDNEGKYEMVEPKELGKAIDVLVREFKNMQHGIYCERLFANDETTAPLPNADLCGVIERPLWLSKKEAEFAHSIKTLHYQASRYLKKIAEKHIANPIEWSLAYLDRGVV